MVKKNIAILCGGQSVEHQISLLSASNVIAELDQNQFSRIVIYITTKGQWLWAPDVDAFIKQAREMLIHVDTLVPVLLRPGDPSAPLLNADTQEAISVDCFFPVLHGALGEDGTMQGLLDILNVPYVGCDCLGSAMSMDKHITKQLCCQEHIPTLAWLSLSHGQQGEYSYDELSRKLSPIFFMKTVNSGSSVGVFKIRNQKEYEAALEEIFKFDDHIIIEKAVVARELEVSVLGNEALRVTPPGEVVVHDDFYTYDAKYFKPDASQVVVPAVVSRALSERLQALALQAARAVRCTGMARIDFLVVSEEEVYLNEINTVPGFTNISMYSKNWLAQGMSYPELLSTLLLLAFKRHENKQRIARNQQQFVIQKRAQYCA